MALLTSTYRAKRFYDLIVVGGAGGVLLTSNNGDDWQSVPSGTTSQIHALAVADNKILVAVGANVRKTENLQSWTIHDTGLSGINDIAHGADKWVVTGSTSAQPNNARTSSSDNGESWTISPSQFSGNSGANLNRITYGSEGFLSQGIAYDSSGWTNIVNRSSVDGVNWSPRKTTGWGSGRSQGIVGHGNGVYFSTYKSGGVSSTPQDLHYGNINTSNTIVPFINNSSDIAYSGGAHVLLANSSSVYRSTNGGASWGWVSTPAGQVLVSVISVFNRFIAVGNGGAIVTSDDGGLTWSLVNHGLTTNNLRRIRAGTYS